MKHPSSRRLFDYWNRRRGNRLAPERGEIEPAAIRGILGDTFILAYEPAGDHYFRLAGTKVCALFCRELKGQSFDALWEAAARDAMRRLVDTVADETVGLVAGVRGPVADGAVIELELLLLPLRYRGGAHARALGVLAPLATPYWLGTTPLESLQLASLRHLGPAVETVAAPRFVSAADSARTRHGLVVYDGGRAD
jgi:hypothetical protein